MGLFGLFGRNRGGDEDEELDLEQYRGMRVEVASMQGHLLFIARLVAIEDDTAQLHQYSEASISLPMGAPLEVRLRGYSDTDSAAVYLAGEITLCAPKTWRVEDLHLVETTNDRAFFRMETNLNARVSPMDRPGTEDRCKLTDISVGGARILSDQTYVPGSRLRLQVRLLPDQDISVITCQVLRVIPKDLDQFEYGCRFLGMSEAEEDHITRIIFDMQRKKRANG